MTSDTQVVDAPDRVVSRLARETAAFDCAVIIPASGCMCTQLEAIAPQLGERDCVVVVWNGPRRVQHDCAAQALQMPSGVWIEHKTLLGAARARNSGVRWVAGRADVLAFADADDVAELGWLSALKKAVIVDRFDVIGGVMRVYNRSGEQVILPGKDFWYLQSVYGCNCAVSRSAWAVLGGFRPNLGTCEDTDLAWRAGECGLRVGITEAAVVVYTLRRGMAEFRQRVIWGRSSIALLRAHGLAVGEHWPTLRGILRNLRANGFATSALLAGFGQFVGQCVGVLSAWARRQSALRSRA